ncbi:unnamed protein product [Rotaria sp. Silwood2]|nr:unnamed protein product [Rotaria sp. Silwood2]CAF4720293.1 unnamed protein product [Rotaria sp. Silwood2]
MSASPAAMPHFSASHYMQSMKARRCSRPKSSALEFMHCASFNFSTDSDSDLDDDHLMSWSAASMPDSSASSHTSTIVYEKAEEWPTGDENIVRYLIKKQKFNGLWNLTAEDIEKLTGKSLSSFPSHMGQETLISAIVIVALETRFATFSAMWHGIVQKARKNLLDLLGKDTKQLESLLENIRQQF